MKKESMDIDRLFETLLQQSPLLSNEKVHHLLYDSPKKAIPGSSIKQFLKTHLNFILMSTMILSIMIGFLTFLNFGSKQNTSQTNRKNQIELLSSKSQMNLTVSSVGKKESTNHHAVSTIRGKDFIAERENINNRNSDTTAKVKRESFLDKKPVNGTNYVLELTPEELKKLGVILTDSSIYYLNLTPDGIISGYNRPYYNLDYKDGRWVKNSRRRKSKKDHNEDILSFHSFYMYCSTNDQVINSFNRSSVCLYDELKQAYPKTNPGQLFYSRTDPSGEIQHTFFILDSLNAWTERTGIYDFLDLPLKSIDDTLVPVKVRLHNEDPVENIKILWFCSNEDFYQALPVRYQEKVREFYEPKKLLKRKYPLTDSNLVDYTWQYEFYDYMENLNYIDLSIEELSKIGIRLRKDTGKYATFRTGLEYQDKNGHTLWCKSPFNLSMSSKRDIDLVKLDLYAPYHSGFKTKILYRLSQYRNDSSLKMKELVPVRVKMEQFKDYCPWLREDMIFWYAPTEAFFDSLPPRIGNELKQDYRTIMIRRDPTISREEKLKLASSCKYFEECKATLFDISFIISPNPVTDNMTIDLELSQPDRISLSLFSVGGSKLLTLIPLTDMPTGRQHLSFSTSTLGPGMYLVTLQNKKGEFKTQRIIKL